MSKEYAYDFYHSKAWHEVSSAYMSSKHYVCERCGKPGVICHHKKYITPFNIDDPNITLNFDNLECLCAACHNLEHKPKHSVTIFDKDGNIAEVKASKAAGVAEEQRAQAEELLRRLAKKESASKPREARAESEPTTLP